jgi:hypothetical protein
MPANADLQRQVDELAQKIKSTDAVTWKSFLQQVGVGVGTAVALGILTLLGNWASAGGLIHALGGVTENEVVDIAKKIAQ